MIDETSLVTGSMKAPSEIALAKKLIQSPVPSAAAYLLEVTSNRI